MELKHSEISAKDKLLPLLIVPYGIETKHIRSRYQFRIHLLIVPYGIET